MGRVVLGLLREQATQGVEHLGMARLRRPRRLQMPKRLIRPAESPLRDVGCPKETRDPVCDVDPASRDAHPQSDARIVSLGHLE